MLGAVSTSAKKRPSGEQVITDRDPRDDASNDTSGRILDAALQRFESQGIAATTMAELAADAGISRGWLYRLFPNREAVLQALISRQIQRHVSALAAQASPDLPLVERLTNAFVFTLKTLRGNALLRRVLTTDRAIGANYLLGDAAPLLRFGVITLTAALSGPGGLKPAQAKRVGETLVRVTFSILITPTLGVDFDNPRELRAYATQIVHSLLLA
ncbi:MAG: hypothetical protein JWN48_3517 [Myxococcaceae bacterium]|nr:hypothetical protein [Myxococcaceae bacterium]